MAPLEKAKDFMNGGSQAAQTPAQFSFTGAEVYIPRDPRDGDTVLAAGPTSLQEIFAGLDAMGVPEDFLSPSARVQLPTQERTEL